MHVQVGAMTNQDDVCELFKEILNNAKARIKFNFSGLEQCSFSYDLPEDGLARISGYLHTKPQYVPRASAVQQWISDDRIKGEVEWTPVFPGKNGDWKQDSIINSILAACDGGTRRLADWVGNSSDTIDRGGRPSAAGSAGGAPKPRGRPPRPPQVATDSLVQAAVRSRLCSMLLEDLRGIFTIIFPNQKGVARSSKESLVNTLMTTPEKLALLAAALEIDGAAS